MPGLTIMEQSKSQQLALSLLASFSDFEIKLSQNIKSSAVEDAMRLRYEVFCLERGFEPTNQMHKEQDQYDPTAFHVVVYHRKTMQVVGCARLVYAVPLPSETHIFPNHALHPSLTDRELVAEISRIVVRSNFRSGPALLFVIFGLTCVAQRQRLLKAYAFMEKRLTRAVGMIPGLSVTCISEDVEFHGKRCVSFVEFQSFYDNILHAVVQNDRLEHLTQLVSWEHQEFHMEDAI